MEPITLLLRGILIGLAIAAPVGPIGVLCIRRTLALGQRAGFVSGLGAATADAVYGSIAGFGMVVLSNILIEQASWLQFVGGLFLIFLGLRTVLGRLAPQKQDFKNQQSLPLIYASTFFLTITNPMTIISFTAVFAGLGAVGQDSVLKAAVLVLGVFLGSTLWWFILSGITDKLGRQFGQQQMVWVNRIAGIIIVGFGIFGIFSLYQQPVKIGSSLVTQNGFQTGTIPDDGFDRALGDLELQFPRDHSAHPGYQTEWWYYTGNVSSENGQRFGYQLTFFRRALRPLDELIERPSTWAAEQVYMVHFAVTHVSNKRHDAFEQMARGAGGLAGANSEPFEVWLDGYQVVEIGPDLYQMKASAYTQDGLKVALDLVLRDTQGPTLQGDEGFSQKGPETGNASYYYSLARLETGGTLSIGNENYVVKGSSWMDHEFSTSALTPDQVGWDWTSLQLDNGSELMFFQIRKEDGTIDPFSSGTLILPDGTQEHLSAQDFRIEVLDTWQSPATKAIYPARWKVELSEYDISLEIIPVLPDQELNVSYAYWEGAVDLEGEFAGQRVTGVGYVELTGYAGSMAGQF